MLQMYLHFVNYLLNYFEHYNISIIFCNIAHGFLYVMEQCSVLHSCYML